MNRWYDILRRSVRDNRKFPAIFYMALEYLGLFMFNSTTAFFSKINCNYFTQMRMSFSIENSIYKRVIYNRFVSNFKRLNKSHCPFIWSRKKCHFCFVSQKHWDMKMNLFQEQIKEIISWIICRNEMNILKICWSFWRNIMEFTEYYIASTQSLRYW